MKKFYILFALFVLILPAAFASNAADSKFKIYWILIFLLLGILLLAAIIYFLFKDRKNLNEKNDEEPLYLLSVENRLMDVYKASSGIKEDSRGFIL